MKLVVFGLTVSSSWGNGHATLWRGLCRALARRGVRVVFFEKDVPYYAGARDLFELEGGELVLYPDWQDVRRTAEAELATADAAIVTSFCPDGAAASELVLAAGRPVRVYYDLDTPVTLKSLSAGERVPYLPEGGLGGFDVVLSYTGGGALHELQSRLGARRVATLYGHVDPDAHRTVGMKPQYRADCSYLGTYSPDRQPALQSLFVDAARLRPAQRFVIGGTQYPEHFPWSDNIYFVSHLPPHEHSAFFSSSRMTLNVTRASMREMGWCPSGRLFEAAACGTPVLSDTWEGLEHFFEPGSEILTAGRTEDTLAALDLPAAEMEAIGRRARQRVLDQHTSAHRADELLACIASAGSPATILQAASAAGRTAAFRTP